MLKNIPFDSIAGNLFSYVCNLYQPGERFPYPLQRGQKGSLLGTVFASYIAFMLRKEQQLPGRERICQEVLALRNPDNGLFEDPDVKPSHYLNPKGHSHTYVTLQTTYFSYACLRALGVSVDRRVFWMAPLLEEGRLEQWLHQLDWRNPWLVSNLDMFVGIFLLEWLSFGNDDEGVAKAVEAYFKWHDENQDSCTGFWGNQDDLLNAMAGAYHILLHYDFSNRHINHMHKIIDTTLLLPWRDGLFVYGGGGGSCEDMDAIDVLVRLSLKANHREKEVRKVLLNAAEMLSIGQNSDGGFGWRIQPSLKKIIAIPFVFGAFSDSMKGMAYSYVYKLLHRSHYGSTHNYSSLTSYPYNISKSDMWSSWFRPLSLAFIAKRYPECFLEECKWRLPYWPGLGYDTFL